MNLSSQRRSWVVGHLGVGGGGGGPPPLHKRKQLEESYRAFVSMETLGYG